MDLVVGLLVGLLLLGTAGGFLYGCLYVGQQMAGREGAVGGGLIGAWALYLFGSYLYHTVFAPGAKGLAEAAERALRERGEIAEVRVSRRHRGKFHRVDFTCERCGMENSISQTITDAYGFLCVRCSFPHAVVFTNWFGR